MSDDRKPDDIKPEDTKSKTAKPFSEGDEREGGKASPGMKDAPHDRADAVGDAKKQAEMPKTTQRQE